MMKTKDLAISSFKKLGYNEPLSKVMTFFLLHKEGTSLDIERKMELHQPEVSIALKELLARKCITRSKMQQKGRGRPYYFYQMKGYPSDIYTTISKEVTRKINDYKDALEKINNLVQ